LSRHWHASRKEAGHCNFLLAEVQDKKIAGYKLQVPYEYVINKIKICSHIVDFVVTRLDGEIEVHEVKGFETKDWRIKHKLFIALYPNIPYVIIR
jgi:hypothetical protein